MRDYNSQRRRDAFTNIKVPQIHSMDSEDEFDKLFNNTAKVANKGFKVIIAMWILGAVVGLALTITIIWAIVEVVQHFT